MSVDPTPEAFAEYLAEDDGQPVYMLNLLRYKPDGGRERYAEYSAATAPFLAAVGGEVVHAGDCSTLVVGPEEHRWDAMLVVRYPSRRRWPRWWPIGTTWRSASSAPRLSTPPCFRPRPAGSSAASGLELVEFEEQVLGLARVVADQRYPTRDLDQEPGAARVEGLHVGLVATAVADLGVKRFV